MNISNRQELLCSQLKWLKPLTPSSPLVFSKKRKVKDVTVTLYMNGMDYVLSLDYKGGMVNSERNTIYTLKLENMAVVTMTEYRHMR